MEDEFGRGQHSVEFMGARNVKLQKGLKKERESITLIVKVAIIAVPLVK
jgi:hypothetical protein